MLLKRFNERLRWRIAILFSGLILILLASSLLIVNRQNIDNAENNIQSNLEATAGVFKKLIELETKSLQDIVKPATSDHAFRQVFGESHKPTLVSAMRNMVSRIENVYSAQMMLVDFDYRIIASTVETQSENFSWPWLIERAESDEQLQASGLALFDNRLHQLIVAPLLIPDPEAWVVIGFPIDHRFANDIAGIGLADISVLSDAPIGDRTVHATSVAPAIRYALNETLARSTTDSAGLIRHSLSSERFLTLLAALDEAPHLKFSLAVHGSLDKELIPYERLNKALLIVFSLGLFFSLAGTYLISRSITEPIQQLNRTVARIGEGDYQARAIDQSADEIGSLARTINRMASDLEEKEKIRNLLGRVVSNEIAEELLNKDIELGGEEREVSVLFADIRNFTALSESMPPSELLSLLNRYFVRITQLIENQHGVVDKYIGDAVMAVFGAPIESQTHATDAVEAGNQIFTALRQFNAELQTEMGMQLEIGIGISSGTVVAGNIGSESRMNYTFIGDTVNTAARIEALTKDLHRPFLISEYTYKLLNQSDADEQWESLGQTKIRGKSKDVCLYGSRYELAKNNQGSRV